MGRTLKKAILCSILCFFTLTMPSQTVKAEQLELEEQTETLEKESEQAEPLIYDTVAELKADSTNITEGNLVRTNGYYSAEDKGGALYKIVKTINGSPDEKKVISLDNGLYGVFQIENDTVNVKQFGAKGDGTEDDREAIATAIKSGAKTICFEPGEYKCADELLFYNISNITIEGNNAVIFTDYDYRKELNWSEHFIIFSGSNDNRASNITIRNLTVETRGTYQQDIGQKYKNQIAFMFVDQVLVEGCKFYISPKITEDIAGEDYAKKLEYSCMDLYTGWSNITIKNNQLINEAAAHYGVCIQFRDIWNGGCDKADFYENYCYSNSKDEILTVFSGEGSTSFVKNVTIRDNEIIADQVPYYERDICMSLGYDAPTDCDNIQVYNNKITGVCDWSFISMGSSLCNSSVHENIITCKTSKVQTKVALVRSKTEEAGEAYQNYFSKNDATIEAYQGKGLQCLFYGRGYFTQNKIVSNEKLYTIFLESGICEDNRIQVNGAVSFIGKCATHVKNNQITITGDVSACFEFYQMVCNKKVEIMGNTMEIQGTIPGTLLMLNDATLNGYPLIFAENQIKTPNYTKSGILLYFSLKDTAPQTIYMVNNQNGAYEEIRQGEITHIISSELPKEDNLGEDDSEKNDSEENDSEEDKTSDEDDTQKTDENSEDYPENGQQNNINEVIPQTENDEIKVTSISISGISGKIAAKKKILLSVKVSPANATNKQVSWKSSNKKYATVNNNGKVTTKKAGAGKTVTIYAEAKDGSGIKASYKIKIMKHAVTGVKIKNAPKTLKAGKSKKLTCTIKTSGKKVNKTLKWTSSNKKYATVDKKGKVTAKKAGKNKTVIITVTSTDGTNKKAKVKIKIK